jgi:hypothetical protein
MTGIGPGLSRTIDIVNNAQMQLGTRIAQIAATSRALSALDTARAALPDAARVPALQIMEAAARISTGPSLVSASLSAQLGNARLTDFTSITSPAFKAAHQSAFVQLSEASRFVERQSIALAAMRPEVEVAQSAALATQAWERVVQRVRPDLTIHLAHLRMTARGTAAAVEAGVLLTEPDEVVVERLQAESAVVVGPAAASEELRNELDAVHPDLRRRLDGAWERIREGGADAAGQAANSLMEAIDWTLRSVAPDADVLTWHAREGRPAGELHNEKPTRTLRVRYAVRGSPGKASAIDLYVRTASLLASEIQSHKHSIETRAVKALAPIAMTVEGLLYYLVVD